MAGSAMRLRMRWTAVAAISIAIGIGSPASAGLVLEPGRNGEERAFAKRLQSALERVRDSEDLLLRELYAAAKASPATIRVRQMTADRTTWHPHGDPERGHVEADDDGRRRGVGRSMPTNATIFVPGDAVEPGSTHWKNGVLVHELVHALDMAYGRYHRDVTVRERRAVFIQNVWRDRVGFRLRASYHGRFATVDYQHAKAQGRLRAYGRYLFTRNDFPPPPPKRPVERDDED